MMFSMDFTCPGTSTSTDIALIVSRLPSEWQGLIGTLRGPLASISTAEVWYRHHFGSQYGQVPTWTSLLESLSVQEPTFTSSGNLTFVPRLTVLPPGVQRDFLTFLLLHLEQISDIIVLNFMKNLQQMNIEDPWMNFLLKQLTLSVSLDCEEKSGVPRNQQCEKSRFGYSFCSHESRALLSQLNDELNSGKECTNFPWQHEYDFHVTRKASSAEPMIVTDTDSQPSQPGVNQTEEDKVTDDSHDVIIITSPVKEPRPGQTHKVPQDSSSGQTIDEPVLKRLKFNHLNVSSNVSFSQAEMSFTQTEEALGSDELVLVEKLRDIWQTATEDTPIPDEVNLFLSCSALQVQKICAMLDLESLEEVSLAAVCNHVCSLGDQLSHQNCVNFLRSAILPKVSELTQTASRILYAVIVQLSQQFPRSVVEAVIVPSARLDDAALPQAELFCKLMKETYNVASRLYLLGSLVECRSSFSDVMLSLIQMSVDLKVNMDKVVITKVIILVENSALRHSNNLKFGKFLLAFVTKYGKQIDIEHIESLNTAIAVNKTFLKKPIVAALTRLLT